MGRQVSYFQLAGWLTIVSRLLRHGAQGPRLNGGEQIIIENTYITFGSA
jgi:hypothetical protein